MDEETDYEDFEETEDEAPDIGVEGESGLEVTDLPSTPISGNLCMISRQFQVFVSKFHRNSCAGRVSRVLNLFQLFL